MSDETFPCEIRWAVRDEWVPAMKMVWKTFLKFEASDYSEEGIKNFFDFITDRKIYRLFLAGEYQMMVALDRGEIIGVASVRNRNHLSLLFVDEEYHRKGIGRRLMDSLCAYLKEEEGEQYMSLAAAPYAVDFYLKIGFHTVGPEREVGGIRVTSMEKYF